MITLYLYENVIQYKEKEKIKEIMFSKKAMAQGKIKNLSLFEKELHHWLQKERYNMRLLKPKSICIILPLHYEEIDQELLTILLNDNGLKKITYQKEQSFFSLKKNEVVINLHETYFTLLKKEKKIITEYYPISLFKNSKMALRFAMKKENPKTCFLFLGSNKEIPTLNQKKNSQKIFYFNNYKTYLLDYENTLK